MRLFSLSAAFCAVFTLAAAPALASGEIRSVTADNHGNAIIITTGGAKIIAVGQAALAAAEASAPQVIEADAAAPRCREVGIVMRGRAHMYGVSDGDPVPSATRIICE